MELSRTRSRPRPCGRRAPGTVGLVGGLLGGPLNRSQGAYECSSLPIRGGPSGLPHPRRLLGGSDARTPGKGLLPEVFRIITCGNFRCFSWLFKIERSDYTDFRFGPTWQVSAPSRPHHLSRNGALALDVNQESSVAHLRWMLDDVWNKRTKEL